MKYRPGESVRRKTGLVQRRNERKQQERKKQLVRRRRKGTFDFIVPVDFWCVVRIFYVSEFLWEKWQKGSDALQMKEYQTAENFQTCIGKNAQRAEAYSGLAETIWNRGGR